MQDRMKLGGIFSEKEASNFLVDEAGKPNVAAYIEYMVSYPQVQQAPLAIGPKLHTFEVLERWQIINDSGTLSAAEAIFEIETMAA